VRYPYTRSNGSNECDYDTSIEPLRVVQLTERRKNDVESFRSMYNAVSAQNNQLSVELSRLSAKLNNPYLAHERIGQAILLSACRTDAKRELQTAVSQARVLVFTIKSTTPFLNGMFQNAWFLIINRVVNGSPVWATVGGRYVMYRSNRGFMVISDESDCAQGIDGGYIQNTKGTVDLVVAPNDLPSDKWLSSLGATLEPQFMSATRVGPGRSWVCVPEMHITVVHGLDSSDPTMAEALQQLARIRSATAGHRELAALA